MVKLLGWGIYYKEKKGMTKAVDKLFCNRKKAINKVVEIRETGLNFSLYTKRVKKKGEK